LALFIQNNQVKMAGIYLHIPFCKQACYYCNFHFSTLLKNKGEMVRALLKEIALQQQFFYQGSDLKQEKEILIETVYFGGGTPSLLEAAEINALLAKINEHFTLAPHCEITLEANPDDIDKVRLAEWLRAGINRLSIGIQSFFAEDLIWMNRAHDAQQAFQCIRDVKETGFENFSADLIYGMPTLTDERWKENIAQMIALEIPHLSCYALTVEPRTPLDNLIRIKKYRPPDEAKVAHQFEVLIDQLDKAGYEQYEISNFAQPGKRSKHNSNYWLGKPYLGIGPAAHSYVGNRRQWNVANNALYMKSISNGDIPFQKEILTMEMQLNEYIMTSLRTKEGCSIAHVIMKWGEAAGRRLKYASKKFILRKHLILQSNHLVLTPRGRLFADGIAAELFC
jgi:oxygen-independent coproporphyrinogen-3 oxidase